MGFMCSSVVQLVACLLHMHGPLDPAACPAHSFMKTFFPLLIQEEQVLSYDQKNGD